MSATFELHVPPEVIFGGGTSERLGEVARRAGLSRALVVTDPYLREHGPVKRLSQDLHAAGVETAVYAEVRPDPTVENVDGVLRAMREHEADGVVAVGGGSSIDAGKAAAIMSRNDGTLADYVGYQDFEARGLPLIAVPTTAGTGSEVTRVAVITDTETDVKMMLLDDKLLPRAAIADHRLTGTCPPELTAYVGIDSLTHAIESYVSSQATPVTDMLALEAARLISGSIRTAFEEPRDDDARERMMLGATLAGMAFSNASVALVHGMSRPIGAHFHLPHGLSNAVLLPAVTRFSVSGAVGRYATIAHAMGVASREASDDAACGALVEWLESLNRDLAIPPLRELGVEHGRYRALLPSMADAALASGSPDFNPRRASADEIVELYESIF